MGIGAQRGLAQMLRYEVGLIVIAAVFMLWNMSSFTFFLGVGKYLWLVFLLGVCILAELNRAPFDFMKGESELVSGFNIEMGRVVFMAFFFWRNDRYYIYKLLYMYNMQCHLIIRVCCDSGYSGAGSLSSDPLRFYNKFLLR